MAEILERVKPYEGKENYIFVSYSHRDSERVFPLLRTLSGQGYRIWYDEGIDPGTEWPESIAAHLAGCKVCLAFISPSSIQSTNCRREINFALSRNKNFLSVVLEPVEMSPGMEMQISTYQSLMSYKYPRWEDFEEKLLSVEILRPCRAELSQPAPEKAPELSYQPAQQTPQPVPVQQVPAAAPVSAAPIQPPAAAAAAQSVYAPAPQNLPPAPNEPKPAAPNNNAASSKKDGKKKLPLIWIILPAAAILIMLAVLLILNPFEKKVVINGQKYTNQSAAVTIHDAAITAENTQGLSQFNKCTGLYFTNCTFESGAVGNFAAMTQLNSLSMKDCEGVDDLSFLSSLSSLYTLTLNGCGLTDAQIPSLEALSKLKTLDLGGNSFTKIPNLPALSTLLMENNRISDLSPLAGISSLRQLNLNGNTISSLSGIEGNTDLKELYLNDNQIRDISALENLVYLEKLHLGGNDVQSTQPLVNCTALSEVDLHGCSAIHDLWFLQNNYETLTFFDMSGIKSVDYSFLPACRKMKKLNVVSCGIDDLFFVSDMTGLEILNAADNEIADLEPLIGCTSLKVVNLADNKIQSLQGLPKVKAEEGENSPVLSLLLHNNQLKNLNGIDSNYQYKILTLYGNPLEDVSALSGAKGYRLIVEMSDINDPSGLNGFAKVYVPEAVTKYRVAWEKALSTHLSYTGIEEALPESLHYANIDASVVFRVD